MRVVRDLIATFFSELFLFVMMIVGGICAVILFGFLSRVRAALFRVF